MGWTVVRRLGRGATGVVELAVDDGDGDARPVAVKRLALHGSATDLAEARQRIRREADVLRRVDHPAVVPLLAVDEDGDDVVLVMPYYGGGTLAERVRGGPLPAEAVAALADRLVGALAAAHRAGVVHRDVKPQNVLFDDVGDAYLADFGVARASDVTTGLTGEGVVVGTPAYMAPEQARGEDVGPASDVFALGATLLFALTGGGPWGDGPADVVFRRAARGRLVRPVPRRDVPQGLRRRLTAMLARDPARRPSAAALVGGPSGTGGATARREWRGRAPRVALGVAAAAAVTVAVALAAGALAGDPRSVDAQLAAPADGSCTPSPYQPCGAPVAPFTDGHACIAAHADYDGVASNGCEAAPDTVDGTPLDDDGAINDANLVPGDDVDRYPMDVRDRFQLLCDGALRVTLTAPANVAQRLRILDGDGDEVAKAISGDGVPATAVVRDPNCLFGDGGAYVAEVSVVSGNSASPYELTRSGSL